jgi:hypothetical protein
MPFDSGAFHRKMMHPPMHDAMNLADFELSPGANAPMRLIELFYGNENAYYNASVERRDMPNYSQIDDLEFDSYLKLVAYHPNREYDERVTALEYQFRDPVKLHGTADAVILPVAFFDYPGVLTQIESWGAIPIHYHSSKKFIPRDLQGAIFDRLTEYLLDKGTL